MAGLWRRLDAPSEVRFYTVQQNDAKITLVELSASGVATTYEATEQGERLVVFSHPEQGRLGFREVRGALELTIERKDMAVERHRLSLQI